jgi:hypothetical protein
VIWDIVYRPCRMGWPRIRLAIGLVAASAATVGESLAADAPPGGLEVGLRLGYSKASGSVQGPANAEQDASAREPMSGRFEGGVPIWLDAGYRILPNVAVAGFFHYDVVLPAKDAGAGFVCCGGSLPLGHAETFGLEGFFHFLPGAMFDPWVGLGFGYEYVTLEGPSGSGASLSYRGWQIVNVQAGIDYRVTPDLAVGFFGAFSVGAYSYEWGQYRYGSYGSGPSQPSSGTPIAGSLYSKALHEWSTFGVRAVYDLHLL